eukprot:EG_transcript_62012
MPLSQGVTAFKPFPNRTYCPCAATVSPLSDQCCAALLPPAQDHYCADLPSYPTAFNPGRLTHALWSIHPSPNAVYSHSPLGSVREFHNTCPFVCLFASDRR